MVIVLLSAMVLLVVGVAFKPDELDPEQSSEVRPRQSGEITSIVKTREKSHDELPPIARTERTKYVWVAKSRSGLDDNKDVYTMDPEDMRPCDNYITDDQNTCDFCCLSCTETLYMT